jgi:hypothetical protein
MHTKWEDPFRHFHSFAWTLLTLLFRPSFAWTVHLRVSSMSETYYFTVCKFIATSSQGLKLSVIDHLAKFGGTEVHPNQP